MKVIVIDDDKLVSVSLKTILEADKEIEVVALGSDGSEALSLYEEHMPDVLLMDIQMKNVNGLSAAEEIIKKHKDAKILLLTTFADDEYIVKALTIGVKGYILKQDFETIIPTIKAVSCGNQSVYGSAVFEKLPVLMKKKGEFDYEKFDLNEKEYEIIVQVAEGLNNKEIAEKLYLSEGTVRNYISQILLKLDLRDRTQLAIFYLKNC